ncbi:MAG: hypothetical protein E7074_06485 [Bacteroidales bacterium]|jgi:hypothetical protein|nr:hypothetical protein [Bacteroidales bacterium]
MKALSYIITGTLFVLFATACNNANNPENNDESGNGVEKTNNNGNSESKVQPKKGELVYSSEDECEQLFFDERLGEDFGSALNNLIASRSELNELGENIYVKKTEMTFVETFIDTQVYLLQFYKIDNDNEKYPLQVLYAAHDAIDNDGNHYEFEFCDGPSDEEENKPVGSYSFEECSDCYLLFVKNYGQNYDEAMSNLKSDINACVATLQEEFRRYVSFDAEQVRIVENPITLTNHPDKSIQCSLIQIQIYSTISNEFTHVKYYGALDSNGDLYSVNSTGAY